jgi:DNA-binding Lrp family transcriptional regulator
LFSLLAEEELITAIVLLKVDPHGINMAAQQLLELEGVSEVYSVAGRYDLIALIRVVEHEKIADVVAEGIATIPDVSATETLVAFRTYHEQDLDAGFALGYPKDTYE